MGRFLVASSIASVPAASLGSQVAAAGSRHMGVISGEVTTVAGEPLSGICVGVNGGREPASTLTARDGKYSIPVPPGSYTVEFFPGCGGGDYAIEWFHAVAGYLEADPVTLTSGAAVSGIDATLGPAGDIAGTVRDAYGRPVPDTCVFAYLSLPMGQNIVYNDVRTGADGSYDMRGMESGTYTVEFVPACPSPSDLALQWYPDVLSQDRASPVEVTAGRTRTQTDAHLAGGASISGRVTDVSGAPLAGICINPIGKTPSGANATFVEATTDGDGDYHIYGLPSGTVTLVFFAGCGGGDYVTTWYGGSAQASATAIPLRHSTTRLPDVVMELSGSLSGDVTDASSGNPAGGICVVATAKDDGYSNSALTDASGRYHLGGLPSGSYQVEFRSGCSGGSFETVWYPGATSSDAAGFVSVTAGRQTTRIDEALKPAP